MLVQLISLIVLSMQQTYFGAAEILCKLQPERVFGGITETIPLAAIEFHKLDEVKVSVD